MRVGNAFNVTQKYVDLLGQRDEPNVRAFME